MDNSTKCIVVDVLVRIENMASGHANIDAIRLDESDCRALQAYLRETDCRPATDTLKLLDVDSAFLDMGKELHYEIAAVDPREPSTLSDAAHLLLIDAWLARQQRRVEDATALLNKGIEEQQKANAMRLNLMCRLHSILTPEAYTRLVEER